MSQENKVRLLRRINLGNYEHYEIEITTYDIDEYKALTDCNDAINFFLESVGRPKLDTSKVKVSK